MKIKLKSKRVYSENLLFAACPVSQALFELIGNKQSFRPMELSLLGRIGFEIEIVGETHPLSEEMNRESIKFDKIDGTIKVT